LRNIVNDVLSALVDAAALEAVVSYDVELKSVHCVEDRMTRVFGADVPGLSISDNEYRQLEAFPHFVLSGRLPLFRRAVADFKRSIKYAGDTGFHCYRAVESLINFVQEAKGITDKKAAIAALEQDLKLDAACIEMLRQLGGRSRHGGVASISGPERSTAIKVTQEILRRFAATQSTSASAPPAFSTLKP
jgi:hypothetical protein